MATLPVTERALLVRTNFSDGGAWNSVCEEMSKLGPDTIQAFELIKMANAHLHDDDDIQMRSLFVEALDDAQFSGMDSEQLLATLPSNYPHTYLFVFDDASAADSEHTLLVVDLFYQRGRSFRTIPGEVQSIDNNLSLANMDWEDFSSTCDEDGVFRGFPGA